MSPGATQWALGGTFSAAGCLLVAKRMMMVSSMGEGKGLAQVTQMSCSPLHCQQISQGSSIRLTQQHLLAANFSSCLHGCTPGCPRADAHLVTCTQQSHMHSTAQSPSSPRSYHHCNHMGALAHALADLTLSSLFIYCCPSKHHVHRRLQRAASLSEGACETTRPATKPTCSHLLLIAAWSTGLSSAVQTCQPQG